MESQHLRIFTKKKNNTTGKRFVVAHRDVILLKADVNYTEIFLDNGERIIVSKTLKEFEESFSKNNNFVRTHKSFVVNLAHVVSFQLNTGMTIKLSNDEVATLSRRRKDTFLAQYRHINQ
jgi:two-component system LytT family response regulator